MNIWGSRIDSKSYRNALAINGLSWPHTERFEATVGDSIRWRVVNATARAHPMHLHGFYFRIDARGDAMADTLLPVAQRPLAVTELLRVFETMAMTWVPERPGNWLFHCHLAYHVVPSTRLDPAAHDGHDRMSNDASLHMAGLVVGIAVRPRPAEREAARGRARRLRLFIQEGARRGLAPRALGFVLQRGPTAPASDSVEIPGSPLVLTRGEPTDIAVTNRLKEPAAIHWHGIELESYSDGVAGWSGAANRLAPSIQPGSTFTAHLTLPRAGTFIYHTHMNDVEQLTSGLYGTIVVLEPGQAFDPARDHLFVLGWDGEKKGVAQPLVLNGESAPGPLELAAGVTHRLRFVNIGPAGQWHFAVYHDSTPAVWRRLARDGADLPPQQAVEGPARVLIAVGETRDMQWTPEPGEYRLTVEAPRRTLVSQRLVVR
jgi:FtsP/CotA-like multicopper oxidase with cupredoxin domain